MFHLQSGTVPPGTAMFSVSLTKPYFRTRSLAVLELRDGDALTCEGREATLSACATHAPARQKPALAAASYRWRATSRGTVPPRGTL